MMSTQVMDLQKVSQMGGTFKKDTVGLSQQGCEKF